MKILPLLKIMETVKNYPQYSVEPVIYYTASWGLYNNYVPGSKEVRAYLLCYRGKCVSLHVFDDGKLIVDAEDDNDIIYVIDGLLNSVELNEHEIEALSHFFMVDKDEIEDIIYTNWLKSKVNDKKIAIIRGTAYILYDGIIPIGTVNKSLIRKLGGRIVESPVTEIMDYINRKINPDFYVSGRGGVIFCNKGKHKCLCFPVEEVMDILTRRMNIPKLQSPLWMKRGRSWTIWVEGERYVSQCPPRRERSKKEEEEEVIHLEYITR